MTKLSINKLSAALRKDFRIMVRDRVGLLMMFLMPVILAVVITDIQNGSFQLMDENKLPMLLSNRDTGIAARQLEDALEKIGLFRIVKANADMDSAGIDASMNRADAMVAVTVPANYSTRTLSMARSAAGQALQAFGLDADTAGGRAPDALKLYYKPIIQESLRRSVNGALRSAEKLVETRQLLAAMYFSVNEKPIPDSLEKKFLKDNTAIDEIMVSRNPAARLRPNATQHNVPSWTIFAMFFVVISLGSSIVREKTSGSFVRLRTLPTPFFLSLVSKQLVYLAVTLLQAALIFSLGIWLFPQMGLPALVLPHDIFGLIVVTLFCGWCAVSYAICVGVFASTQEQSNGFGAVSIVILTAIGGLMVPSFAMPDSFRPVSKLSPLHWCLESYNTLFLEGGSLKNVWPELLPLIALTLALIALAFLGLKRKRLI